MIEKIWEQMKQAKDVRQNISRLRKEIKDKASLQELLCVMQDEEDRLIDLLKAEDAKTRKNAALLMGDLGKQEFLTPVYHAYKEETQRFVKSSYLSAIANFDYSAYIEELKERLAELEEEEITEENRKHIMEETRELSALIIALEGAEPHKFCGWDETYDIILLTNRNFAHITEEELRYLEPAAVTKIFSAGVMARVEGLHWLQELRTYQELLFSVGGMKTCPMDPFQAAEIIVNSKLLTFLSKSHKGEPPFYFRVEMKSKWELSEKSTFVKKLSGQIERLSGRKLINTTADYEIELRLIENKSGSFNILVKLYTLRDERFAYRREFMPTSIKPVNAALVAALTKDYMKEDGQVLDPFCGVGTMLIERYKAVKANTSYGVDLQEEAIIKARSNTEHAGQLIHYVNRDFFRFEHEYYFDEIITNMPFQIGRTTKEEIFDIYQRFFSTASRHLKEDAILILYSHDKELVEKMSSKYGYCILEKYEISKKEETYVFVLQDI